jgi:hypothetical protein
VEKTFFDPGVILAFLAFFRKKLFVLKKWSAYILKIAKHFKNLVVLAKKHQPN